MTLRRASRMSLDAAMQHAGKIQQLFAQPALDRHAIGMTAHQAVPRYLLKSVAGKESW